MWKDGSNQNACKRARSKMHKKQETMMVIALPPCQQKVKFSGLTICHAAKSAKSEIILDCGSKITLIKDMYLINNNQNYTKKIVTEKKSGKKWATEVEDLPGYGEAFYEKSAMINLMSLLHMLKK